ncbi:MAG: hydroxyphenylacetyl-CoA thioesterase PaaI [Desulfovibrionaceae bacterium]|jgi:acyl-CoA thioesterase|nr:hydroxyphenylacetyl-CoA thioesterase PaaI [Desulfovibrionaceae bacterium]
MTELSAQQTADFVGNGMFANDRAVQGLNIRLASIAPGRAAMTMAVGEHMLNGHETCHGGFIAVLADSAFAYACNSYGEATVASGFSIDFMAPARSGDVLTASSVEVSRAGRTGVYDTEVTNQRGERIAVFRGRSYTLKGKPAVMKTITQGD